MPLMTNNQRKALLIHIYTQIFTIIRFPFYTIKPGTELFVRRVHQFQERVAQLRLAPAWGPWIIGGTAVARTFKCAELGAQILIGFDVNLDISQPTPYPIRVLEQNPYKRDGAGNFKETALLAQRGVKLAWVIKNVANSPGVSNFLGKVQDGVFHPNQPRAYTPKQTMTPLLNIGAGVVQNDVRPDQYGTDHIHQDGDWLSDVDDIDPNEIPIGIT